MSASQVVTLLESDDLRELRAEFPDYVLWYEQTPRRAQYVGRCLHLHARPHTVITSDLAELRDALRQGQAQQAHAGGPDRGTLAPVLAGQASPEYRDGSQSGGRRYAERSAHGQYGPSSCPAMVAGARSVPTAQGLILAARELMARTVDLPAGRSELLTVLGEYRRVLFALTVQGIEL